MDPADVAEAQELVRDWLAGRTMNRA
jgi:hypothetical protein